MVRNALQRKKIRCKAKNLDKLRKRTDLYFKEAHHGQSKHINSSNGEYVRIIMMVRYPS